MQGFRHQARRLVTEAALEDGWGDPVAWLRDAIVFFDARGHQRVVSACRSLLRKAGVPVPRKGRGETEVPDALRALGVTTREMDVLVLLSEGLSNKEIAERLYLSHRPVERHVASLLAKTETRSRSQLIAIALTGETPASRAGFPAAGVL
jgi:DNA-binding NarL/FixJ family response regulator